MPDFTQEVNPHSLKLKIIIFLELISPIYICSRMLKADSLHAQVALVIRLLLLSMILNRPLNHNLRRETFGSSSF